MKKNGIIACLAITALLSTMVSACTCLPGGFENKTDVKEPLAEAPDFVSKTLVDLGGNTATILGVSDGYSNGGPFGVDWNKENVVFDAESKTMELSVSKQGNKYFGGEIKTIGTVGAVQYGYFGCEMKPSGVLGTASTFFTYTGEYENNPHDEIDIEFLGKDTTKVQFNYFVNGVGGHEYMFDLGFDASEEYHHYGFYWDEESIVWYVDHAPVYAVKGEVPSSPQRLYANAWAGNRSDEGIMDWMGSVDENDLPATVSYREITVAYLNGSGLDVPAPEYVPELSEFTPSTIQFNKGNTDVYTVTTSADKTSNTITYTNVLPKTYKNVYGTVDENVQAAEFVAMKIKNNGTEDRVDVRIDIRSKSPNAAGLKAINVKAWQDGKTVKTDLKYGGSFFTVQPGEEIVCVVKYYGIPSEVMIMADSAARKDKDSYAGSITVTDFMYAGESNYVEEKVSLDQNYLLMVPGDTIQLNPTSTGEVVWSVENPNVATVVDGLVTAVGEGTTIVKAKTGAAVASCTVKVSTTPPKEEETLTIVAEEDDLAHKTSVKSSTTNISVETENTYNDSSEAIAWKGGVQYDGVIIGSDQKYKVTSDGYVEYYFKNIGHTPSGNGETINGIFLSIYDVSAGARVGEEIKLYKNYNATCATDAGNGWVKWNVPLSLFNAAEGAEFDGVKLKLYVTMDGSEAIYLDGLHFVAEEVASAPDTPDNPDNPDNPGDVDHTAETLPIASDGEDLAGTDNCIYANGTMANENVNTYGTSAQSVAWTGITEAYQNAMWYANGECTALTIVEKGYIEFFIKDVGHTSSEQARANGVTLRLYNGDNSTKVDGVQDVKAYKDYNAEYRTDAGNGWSYYKLPLSLFGAAGATFDRIRFAVNMAFDENEVMYLDGMRVVLPTDEGSEEPDEGEESNVDKGDFVTASFTSNVQYAAVSGDATNGYTLTTDENHTYCRLRVPGSGYSEGMFAGKTVEFTFKPAGDNTVADVKLATNMNTSSYLTISLSASGYDANGVVMTYEAESDAYTVKINAEAFFTASELNVSEVKYFLLQIDGSVKGAEICTFTGMYIY